jgi:outer membrane protein TolC
VPLYLGGQLQAEVRVRTAEQKEAVADYGRAGANAFAEVEKALSAGFALNARQPLLTQAVTENSRAVEFALTRYRVGSDDLRAVEQQQLLLFSARSTLLRVQSEQLVQRVNLHLALGGNFEGASASVIR